MGDFLSLVSLETQWIPVGILWSRREHVTKLKDLLTTPPLKGSLDPVIPTAPLIYRFYEIMQVYGMPMKDVIQEKFGDGIMSAIDFTINIDKIDDPKGDRVKVSMCGKFLPY